MSTKKLNPKILIVEDNVTTYNNLKDFFIHSGFEVVGAYDDDPVDSYDKAVAILQKEPADIALLDIEINGDKDGLELGKYIYEHYRLPVIFLTSKDTLDNRLIADTFASIPIIEKIPKTIPNETLLKSIGFLWTKILLQTPPPDAIEVRAVEMVVRPDNFSDASAESEYFPIKRKIYCRDIHFISSFNNRIKGKKNYNLIHISGSKAFRVRNTIDELLALLSDDFIRISKFAAVNIRSVRGYDRAGRSCNVNGYDIKIGKDYWDHFLQKSYNAAQDKTISTGQLN